MRFWFDNLDSNLNQVHAYLRDRPAGNPSNPQTPEGIASFVRAVESFDLEKAEILQLVNCAPRTLPVLFNCIEECDQRLSDEQMDELLELVAQNLGSEPMPEAEAPEAEAATHQEE